MMNRLSKGSLLIMPVALLIGIAGSGLRATASPSNVFTPYLERIRDNLPPGLQMRLPSQVPVSGLLEGIGNQYRVEVTTSMATTTLTVSLFNCEDNRTCLVGSFSVDSLNSTTAKELLRQHRAVATPVILAKDIQGYLLEGQQQNPSSEFSSVMWEQDGLIYTVRFLARERNNILFMAYSMANESPIYGTATAVPEVAQTPEPVTQVVQAPEPSCVRAEPTQDDSLFSQSSPSQEQSVETQPLQQVPDLIFLRKIKVTGNTVFSPDEIAQIVQPFERGYLTPEKFKDVADQITQLYLSKGYITSSAKPITQTIEDGVLEIRVTEGRLAEIQVAGLQRLNPSYVCSRIKLGVNTPLSATQIEEQLRLLRADPLFSNVEATLRRVVGAEEEGQSTLLVKVEEANPIATNVFVDNYSPPSVGSERFGVGLRHRNLTGRGDELAGSYYRSTTGGAYGFDFSYRLPLNPMNGTLLLRAAPNRNEITQPPFDELDIRGETDLYEISYRQPLVRKPREEFALSLGFTFQDGQTFLFDRLPTPFGIGPDENGVSRTSVFKFAQDYLRRSSQGVWFLRSQFNLGTNLFDATTNEAPIPDGQFFSWLGQVRRVQRLGDDHLLNIQADLQLTPDSLLPSQQFVIGGGQSVRGYRQNARSGDNAFRFSIEDRIAVWWDEARIPTIQIIPFFDMGAVWNVSDNPNKLPDQSFLMGAGIGLQWDKFADVEGLSVRLDYGIPFINIEDRGTNAQDEGFYFSVIYQP